MLTQAKLKTVPDTKCRLLHLPSGIRGRNSQCPSSARQCPSVPVSVTVSAGSVPVQSKGKTVRRLPRGEQRHLPGLVILACSYPGLVGITNWPVAHGLQHEIGEHSGGSAPCFRLCFCQHSRRRNAASRPASLDRRRARRGRFALGISAITGCLDRAGANQPPRPRSGDFCCRPGSWARHFAQTPMRRTCSCCNGPL